MTWSDTLRHTHNPFHLHRPKTDIYYAGAVWRWCRCGAVNNGHWGWQYRETPEQIATDKAQDRCFGLQRRLWAQVDRDVYLRLARHVVDVCESDDPSCHHPHLTDWLAAEEAE